MSAAEIGICATVGKSEVLVGKLPKVLIISSGDELVEINEKPETHQIRKSNVYWMEMELQKFKCEVHTAHLQDNYDEIVEKLKGFVAEYQIIVLSGAVSMGNLILPKALRTFGRL